MASEVEIGREEIGWLVCTRWTGLLHLLPDSPTSGVYQKVVAICAPSPLSPEARTTFVAVSQDDASVSPRPERERKRIYMQDRESFQFFFNVAKLF